MLFSKNYSSLLLFFIFSHVVSYISLAIIPAEASVSNLQGLFWINFIFLLAVIFFSFLAHKIFIRLVSVRASTPMSSRQLNFNIKSCSLLSLLGISFIAYDRIFIRAIDYGKGVRAARYQWLSTEGGSVFGIIGNLLVPLAYVAIFFITIHMSRVSKFNKIFFSLLAVGVILAHSYLNGGRSNILLLLVFVATCLIIRREGSVFSKKAVKNLIYSSPLIVISVFYVFMVIESSASMGGTDIITITRLGINMLYGQPTQSFNDFEKYGELPYLIIYSISYLYHGQWTAQASLTMNESSTSFVFYPVLLILGKIGFVSLDFDKNYFSELGIFISLPGALVYDFGYLGLVAFSSLLGASSGMLTAILKKRLPIGGVMLSVIFLVFITLLLSPVIPAFGFSYLYFILFSFIFMGLVNRVLFKKNVDWL